MSETQDQTQPKSRRLRVGTVRSISGSKTINVVVANLVRHSRYGKYIRTQSKLAVHDPNSSASVGDRVEIAPCRRLSKTKSWRLVRVVRSAAGQA